MLTAVDWASGSSMASPSLAEVGVTEAKVGSSMLFLVGRSSEKAF